MGERVRSIRPGIEQLDRTATEECILCDGAGELWISGEMIPCRCGNVKALLARTREELERVTAQRDRLRDALREYAHSIDEELNLPKSDDQEIEECAFLQPGDMIS